MKYVFRFFIFVFFIVLSVLGVITWEFLFPRKADSHAVLDIDIHDIGILESTGYLYDWVFVYDQGESYFFSETYNKTHYLDDEREIASIERGVLQREGDSTVSEVYIVGYIYGGVSVFECTRDDIVMQHISFQSTILGIQYANDRFLVLSLEEDNTLSAKWVAFIDEEWQFSGTFTTDHTPLSVVQSYYIADQGTYVEVDNDLLFFPRDEKSYKVQYQNVNIEKILGDKDLTVFHYEKDTEEVLDVVMHGQMIRLIQEIDKREREELYGDTIVLSDNSTSLERVLSLQKRIELQKNHMIYRIIMP